MTRVLVTAGAAGIGKAIVAAFHAAGNQVFTCDVDEKALTNLFAERPGVGGVVADVAELSDCDRLVAAAVEALGGVDILINNAGIGGPRNSIEATDESEWDRCIAVNLNAPFYLMKRVIPFMKAQRAGAIINISTSSARTGLPNRSAYVASKVGLLGLTQNAARELGPWNIRCNAILPGLIDNARGRSLIDSFGKERGLEPDAARAAFLSYISMRTMIDPDEVAAVALFLASENGRHISGQEIGVCGNVEWES
jgi:NAD(P)-dependent dehydrogenase (short-subunit alcohol dehydrogenase family)